MLFMQIANSISGKNKPADAVTLKQPVKALAEMLNHKDEMCPQPFFSRQAKTMTFVTAKQPVKLVQAVAENLDRTLPDPLESNQPLSWLCGSLDQSSCSASSTRIVGVFRNGCCPTKGRQTILRL